MRHTLFLFLFTLVFIESFAQVPDKFSYQAIIRNSDNTLVIEKPVSVKIVLYQGNVNGINVYEENHSVITNSNGLVSMEIGNGTVVSGEFDKITWSKGPFFIETRVDPTGGDNYSIVGVSQLLSVPFAIHAKYAENLLEGGRLAKTSALIIQLSESRLITSTDINNTIECIKNATLNLPFNFLDMKIGETMNLEAHNGALLRVQANKGVSLNYMEKGVAEFNSEPGNVRFGLLRKSGDNEYIISGQ